jgi:Putative phage tail protein
MPSSIVIGAAFGSMEAAVLALGTFGAAAATFAINYAVSTLVSRAFGSRMSQDNPSAPDSGVRQQIPPSNSNSLPVVYGDAYLGGVFVDAVLSTDQKTMYYVLAVSHISPAGQFSFDQTKMYWGDRLITFDGTDLTKVVSLTDGSGNVDTKCSGNIYMGLYTSSATGVITSTNGATAPSTFMGGADVPVALRWPTTGRQMHGLAFAIVKLNYNQDAGVTGMQGLTFHASHYLNGTGAAKPGDVWYDYIRNVQYGGAVANNIANYASSLDLNDYSDATITYTPSGGGSATQPRYRINGVIDTAKSCVENLDNIMTACDSWTQYSAAKGQFSVVINQDQDPTFSADDDTIMGEIRVSAIDIANQVNQLEAQFPSKLNKDQTDFVFLQTPSGLLYPNEPVNKSTIKMELVNDSVQAQYLANRMLEQAREDLIVTFALSYPGIQVDAGDVISVTNASYGWTSKLFRVMKVNEVTTPDGSIAASFELNEFNSAVYGDGSIAAYAPAPNSSLLSPQFFSALSAPTITSIDTTSTAPSFAVACVMPSIGQVSTVDLYYTTASSPTALDWVYLETFTASTTVILTAGSTVTFQKIQLPANTYKFAFKVSNKLSSSVLSAASSSHVWAYSAAAIDTGTGLLNSSSIVSTTNITTNATSQTVSVSGTSIITQTLLSQALTTPVAAPVNVFALVNITNGATGPFPSSTLKIQYDSGSGFTDIQSFLFDGGAKGSIYAQVIGLQGTVNAPAATSVTYRIRDSISGSTYDASLTLVSQLR